MRYIKYILIIVPLALWLAGCVDNDPKFEKFPSDNMAFTYQVEGDYALDYLVGSPIKFTNTSVLQGAPVWDFGDGTPHGTGDEVIHTFQVAGTYDVTLTIEGKGQLTQKLLISDIFPTITVAPIEGGICEVNVTPVHFSVSLPNPQGLNVKYFWLFPEGTKDEAGNPITASSQADPGQLFFGNIGSQRVVLKTELGGRLLQDGVLNVQVGYSVPVKTLYYAEKGGNIKALKLVSNLPSGMKNIPFDMGVKSGQHAFNLLFSDSSLYILDAGLQFYYINDVDGNLGDGSIARLSKDGKVFETILTNQHAAFDDPFYGYADNNNLYFSDRNTGITRIAKTERNMAMDRTNPKLAYYVQNATLNYYKAGWDFGAMNACFTRLKDGVWWWSKTYNGMGIFRFRESDILSAPTAAGSVDKRPFPILADGMFIKSFVVDEERGWVYYAVRDKGFYKSTLADFTTAGKITAANPGTLVQELVSDNDGSTGEYVDICQMVLDPEDGSVYFGYRKSDASSVPSGLKRYNYGTGKVESLLENVNIYGVAINHTKSKLF